MNTDFNWKKDKWKDIEDLIKRWQRRNPEGFTENMRYVRARREDLKDKKFGGGDVKGGMTLGLAVHPELMNYIETFYPDFMKKNDDMVQFAKRFPAFKVAEKTRGEK